MKKKILATLLAALMLASYTTAFAEDTEVDAISEDTEIEEVVEATEEDADAEEATEEDADAEEATEEDVDAEEAVEEEVEEEVVEEVEEVEFSFSDVAEDAAYLDAVMWAYENGVTTGYADGTFRPADTCTRGQVVTFLYRAMGEPEVTTTENPFSDVSEDSAFYTAILWAVENGITTGYADGTFRPAETCTSAHVVTFLHRAVGEPEATVESELSAEAGTAFVAAINWADQITLLEGIEFVAGDASPRSDIVTYLYLIASAVEAEIEA